MEEVRMKPTITHRQMKRLQTVYGQFARRSTDITATAAQTPAEAKAARIAWASERTGRTIRSFSDLTFAEAQLLIDWLQGVMGVKAPATKRPRLDRRAAQAAGTAGRHDDRNTETTMASAADTARIQYVMGLIGWSEETLQRWLVSGRSPLRGRSAIRTLKDANKVYWALKGIAVRKGVWQDEKTFRQQAAPDVADGRQSV
jgi:hypothetical protein